MRHRIDKKSFNRDTKSRRSLLHGVAVALLEHGEIVTTKAKGFEASRLIESCISQAKVGDLAARRRLHRIFGRRDVVNNLCDRVAPVFASRQSGFTRMVLLGNRRGDNTAMYRLSLVEVLPPSKKTQALAEKAAAKTAGKSKKTNKKIDRSQDLVAQQAVKHDQSKAAKVTKLTQAERTQKNTGRTSVAGGGRGT